MEQKIEEIRQNFEKHGMNLRYVETPQQAAELLSRELKDRNIVFGGSVTSEELGLYDLLGRQNRVYWHWKQPVEQRREAEQQMQVYITSANALSATGEIVNIDGSCNRISGATYGPQVVYYICGINKLTDDLSTAIDRARNVAAPMNARRLNRKTPCAVDGKCHDCQSPDRICNVMNITMRRPGAVERVEILLVGCSLGY